MRANGIIFVIDASDPERFTEATNELNKIMQAEELTHAPLLVLANKQDNPGAVSGDALTTQLDLPKFVGTRPYLVQSANATSGTGLWEGLTWLVDKLKEIHKSS